MKRFLPALLVCFFYSGCYSGEVLIAPQEYLGGKKLGRAKGTACGSIIIGHPIINLIPIRLNSRIERAYENALESVPGADGLTEIEIEESWWVWVLGSTRCTTIRGVAVSGSTPPPKIESNQPPDSKKPIEADKPTDGEKPGGLPGDQPGETGKPLDADQPGAAERPPEENEPAAGEKPTRDNRPQGSERPVESDKPAESSKPGANARPAEMKKPTEDDPPGDPPGDSSEMKPDPNNAIAPPSDTPARQESP